MSGLEGVEREDHDEREAGVGANSFNHGKASTTKDTKVHEEKTGVDDGLTGGFASVE